MKHYTKKNAYYRNIDREPSKDKDRKLTQFCMREFPICREMASQRAKDWLKESKSLQYAYLKTTPAYEKMKRQSSEWGKRQRRITPEPTYQELMDHFEPDVNTGMICGSVHLNQKTGYLSTSWRSRTYLPHRLVMMMKIGTDIPDNLEVNHLDCDKLNNRADNLELVTHQRNLQHAAENRLYQSGEDHWKSKLTQKQVDEIRAKYKPFVYTRPMLSKEYNVTIYSINAVLDGLTWQHSLKKK